MVWMALNFLVKLFSLDRGYELNQHAWLNLGLTSLGCIWIKDLGKGNKKNIEK